MMDPYPVVEEIIVEMRRHVLDHLSPHVIIARRDADRGGIRASLATVLVRIGATIDAEAARRLALRKTEESR
jgi:hypothetical protein